MCDSQGKKIKVKGKRKGQKWQFVPANGKASKWHKGRAA